MTGGTREVEVAAALEIAIGEIRPLWLTGGPAADGLAAAPPDGPAGSTARRILLCRTERGLFAIAERCPHAAWSLADGSLDGSQIVCNLHGARFALADGRPTAGPTSKWLDTYPVDVREGRVYVSIPR